MPNFAALESKKNQLIRKSLGGSLFIGDITASLITAITGSDSSLQALPNTGGSYTDAGLMTDDGMRFSRNIETADVTSFGRYDPSRTDVTSDVETLQVDLQETSLRTISMFTGVPQSSIVPATGSGEVSIAKPARPNPRQYRALCLMVDGPSDAEIYIGRYFARAQATDYADQAYNKGDELRWGMTLTGKFDQAAGYSVRHFFGGPGWKALLQDMGFPAS